MNSLADYYAKKIMRQVFEFIQIKSIQSLFYADILAAYLAGQFKNRSRSIVSVTQSKKRPQAPFWI
ncbi:hypothetical protein [Rhodoferax sp.]|uniref:hypothetical protein n=1 Tax=Rhodoferax sp. TaxID=50421 RepID=UPI003BB569D8